MNLLRNQSDVESKEFIWNKKDFSAKLIGAKGVTVEKVGFRQ